ncbi:GntR family transcriptional regulator [Mycolicibacterium fallax]|uniref:GntR family transcriptional regulator n=1 Tax=Mycolicibacterium fallax TaxID=1793 RepID=A0A1X1QXP3_MYCFA|nr:GntR family transcriptional regulator [Mycolicibacterium fallax]ORU96105.1 GntR family transcriptional regulator [Mycolicibacterium fallax]BBZ00358.1 GntR family transcriptional regulator [Mycolicibacterium fallax]HOW93787.1 GntR family transcriptional regulator [Mycolicibacterium fallax]HSA40691.1 GntR family transcriptional regulator [Mycobacterium sp.]
MEFAALQVDPSSSTPIFDQLRGQIVEAVRDGRLAPGTRLPTVRELAAVLGLAVNTVARTYRELESAGIVETRGRRGSFVARRDAADATMAAAAQAFVAAARSVGLGRDAALGYLDAAFTD